MKNTLIQYLMALMIGPVVGYSIGRAACSDACTLITAMGNISTGSCTHIPDGMHTKILSDNPIGGDDTFSLPTVRKWTYEFCDPVCTQDGNWQEMTNLAFQGAEQSSTTRDKYETAG